MQAAIKQVDIAAAVHQGAGVVVYTGHIYDRRLNRCRIYAVADGQGGTEWRVVRERYEGDESGVERCFASYAEAMRWIA